MDITKEERLFRSWLFSTLRGALYDHHERISCSQEEMSRDLGFFTDETAVGMGFRMLTFEVEKALAFSDPYTQAPPSVRFYLDGLASGAPTLVSPKEGKVVSFNAIALMKREKMFSTDYIIIGRPMWWLRARNSYLDFIEKCRSQYPDHEIICSADMGESGWSFRFSCHL